MAHNKAASISVFSGAL